MATTANFKFQGVIVDGAPVEMGLNAVPAVLAGDVESTDLRELIVSLYENHTEAIANGKFIFGNNDDSVNAPVLQIIAVIIQYDLGGDEGTHQILIHFRDASSLFRVG